MSAAPTTAAPDYLCGRMFNAIADDADTVLALLDQLIREEESDTHQLRAIRAVVGRIGCFADLGTQLGGVDAYERDFLGWMTDERSGVKHLAQDLATRLGRRRVALVGGAK